MTSEKAKQYLRSLRINLPSDVIDDLVSVIESRDDCLEQYPDSIADLIKLNVLALLALTHSFVQIESERAASGDARTFASSDDLYNRHYNALRALDTRNCVTDLVVRENTKVNAGLWVACGGCL